MRNSKTMEPLVEKLKSKLDEMSDEELDSVFKTAEEFKDIGPDAEEFINILLKDQKDIDIDLRRHIDEHFWELI